MTAEERIAQLAAENVALRAENAALRSEQFFALAAIWAMSIFFNAWKVAFFGGQPSVSGGAATAR